MRLLFLGDVVGRSGRDVVIGQLSALKERFAPDVTIVNAENAAAGFGVTLKIASAFFEAGADLLTSGNHIWDQKEMLLQIEQEPRLLRPLNYPVGTPGRGFVLHRLPDGRQLLLAHLMGRVEMNAFIDNPFTEVDKLLSRFSLGAQVQALFVDFHAEATSEKQAMGHYLDGRVSALVGTHTHVPTADACILPRGTAYQTDVGMCGDRSGIIGFKPEGPLARFLHPYHHVRLEPGEGPGSICGVFVETHDETGLASHIESFQLTP